MKLVSMFVTALALSASLNVHADLLTLTPATPAVMNTGVVISASGKATIDNKDVNLTTVGNGLRWQVVLLKVNIFVAELLVSDTAAYKKNLNGALDSFDNEQSVSLVMNMLFSPPNFLVLQDFNAAIKAQNLSQNDPDIAAFMAVVKTLTFRSGGKVTLLFVKDSAGNDTLYSENKLGPNQAGTELAPLKLTAQGRHKILSLWFGTPADDATAAFQQEMMK